VLNSEILTIKTDKRGSHFQKKKIAHIRYQTVQESRALAVNPRDAAVIFDP